MAGGWTRVTQGQPCPLCGAKKYCSTAENGDVVCCMNTEHPPPGWHRQKSKKKPARGGIYRVGNEPKYGGPSWDDLHTEFRKALDASKLGELAHCLGLPIAAIKPFQPGWCEWYGKKHYKCFTVPLRKANGDICGIHCRAPNGEKWLIPKDHRKKSSDYANGLYIPVDHDWRKMRGPIFAVEGFSDSAACLSVGIPAIGRTNDTGGLTQLIPLLRDREIIVIGEFDMTQKGETPGKDGAKKITGGLAQAWGHPVRWAMPPEKTKDCRKWIGNNCGEDDDRGEVGNRLRALVSEFAQEIATLAEATGRALITNVIDDEDEEGKRRIAIPMPLIRDQVFRITGNWPRRCNGLLFTAPVQAPPEGELPDPDDVWTLDRADSLFAYLSEEAEVRWTKREAEDQLTGDVRNPPTKGEFFASMKAKATPNYESIEFLPHEPPRQNCYYQPMRLPRATGDALKELREHLNAETDLDRDLMIACFLTMAWGGPPGRRPAFVYTSDHGQGSGKTRTVLLLAEPWGGAFTAGEHEDWETVRTRLLDDRALRQRAVIIDNVRGKLARSGLEAAVTSEVIDGKRMYLGQFSRPNILTWLITANTPALSKDLADRSVVIKVGKPKHDAGDFEDWSSRFIAENRAQLMADALDILKRGPVAELDPALRDRWGLWQDSVLCCFPNANELASYIKSGRPEVDQDLNDAIEISRIFHLIAERMGLNADEIRLSVSKKDLRTWLVHEGTIVHTKSLKGTTMWIDGLRGLKPLKPLHDDPHHGSERRWLWIGESAPAEDTGSWDYDMTDHGPPDQPRNQQQLPGGRYYSEEESAENDPPPKESTPEIPF